MQEIVGQKLTDFYYTTDSLVTLLAGKRYPNDKGTMDSEYSLKIWGVWSYIKDGKTIETSSPKSSDENLPQLRSRLEDFISNLHPSKITSISISDDGETAEIGLDTGGKFEINRQNKIFLSYAHKTYDNDGKFVSATQLRVDQETGELSLFEVS